MIWINPSSVPTAIKLESPCHLTIEGNEKESNLWLFDKNFGDFKKGECFITSYK